MFRQASMWRAAAVGVAAGMLVVPGAASAASAPDLGRPFVPRPASEALYGLKAPADDPDRQHQVVVAADGVELWTETWLPAPKGAEAPPGQIPTVLVASPYLARGADEQGVGPELAPIKDHLVARGYAFTYMHLRGTGGSGGCFDAVGSETIDDVARVIEWLGRDAPWSDGDVGMYGRSYLADAQTATAGRGDPERIRYLKAIVPIAAMGGQYEINFFDGVPFGSGVTTSNFIFNLAITSALRESTPAEHVPDRAGCQPALLLAASEQSGGVTAHWRDREYRGGIKRAQAAMLLVHGFGDSQRDPDSLFHNVADGVPHKLVSGWWEHDDPDDDQRALRPEWARADWRDMVTAWFDRWLKGLPTRVQDWPQAQVQGSDGQWRAEPDWVTTGGPPGQLALTSGGRLGAAAPTGSSSYVESMTAQDRRPGDEAVFETAPLPGRLQLTGRPVLDLWVTLDNPDAHLAARLELLDAGDAPLYRIGLRSARHLEPLLDGYFAQEAGIDPPVDVPIRVPIRFEVIDLVAPAGSRLRLTLSGTTENEYPPSDPTNPNFAFDPFLRYTEPSGSGTKVTVLHDCKHTSALRFLLPRRKPDLLNVREKDEPAGQPLADNRPFASPVSDADGLVTRNVCGRGPIEPQRVSSEKPGTEAPGSSGCHRRPGFRRARARPRRRGLVAEFATRGQPDVSVALFRHTRPGGAVRSRRVAAFGVRTSPFHWNGRRPTLRDGWYSLRLRIRGPGSLLEDRLLGVRRVRGRWRVLPGYHLPAPCSLVTYFTLARPIFGGRRNRALPIVFRLNARARVRVVVRSRGRIVKRFAASDYGVKATHRLLLRPRGLPRGRYTVVLTATRAGKPTRRTGSARRL